MKGGVNSINQMRGPRWPNILEINNIPPPKIIGLVRIYAFKQEKYHKVQENKSPVSYKN